MFLYVMNAESRDMLLDLGYELLKENSDKTLWVFINKSEKSFDTFDVPAVVSDVLTF